MIQLVSVGRRKLSSTGLPFLLVPLLLGCAPSTSVLNLEREGDLNRELFKVRNEPLIILMTDGRQGMDAYDIRILGDSVYFVEQLDAAAPRHSVGLDQVQEIRRWRRPRVLFGALIGTTPGLAGIGIATYGLDHWHQDTYLALGLAHVSARALAVGAVFGAMAGGARGKKSVVYYQVDPGRETD